MNLIDGMYISWPFCNNGCTTCVSPCFACDSRENALLKEYKKALDYEISTYFNSLSYQANLQSIYLGGSWGSVLPLDMPGTLIDIVRSQKPETQITLEIKPSNLINKTYFEDLKKIGVNRVCVGGYSLKDLILQTKKLQEPHIASFPVEWFNCAIDIVIDTIDASYSELAAVFNAIDVALIQHVSFSIDSIDCMADVDDKLICLYDTITSILRDRGFEQYEMLNFALPGYESKQNTIYWDRSNTFKGFGLSAASFDGTSRTQNTSDLAHYLKKESPIIFKQELHEIDSLKEQVMLMIRMPDGVSLAILEGYYACLSEKNRLQKTVSQLKEAHYIIPGKKGVRLTTKGLMFEQEVLHSLFFGI